MVKEADNEVLDGIRKVSTLLETGRLMINKKNILGLIAELYAYVWDDKAVERGEVQTAKAAGPRAGRPALLHQFTAGLEVRVSVQTQ